MKGHLSYIFQPGLSVGTGLGYGFGDAAKINGVSNQTPRSNLIWAVSAGIPINRRSGIKIAYIGSESLEDTGADTHTFSIGFSLMW